MHTFITSSIYITLTVAMTRYLEMKNMGGTRRHWSRRLLRHPLFGLAQSLIVFICATALNLSRWFEYEIVHEDHEDHVHENHVHENHGHRDHEDDADDHIYVQETWLRNNSDYEKYYRGIGFPLCGYMVPMAIMLISTFLLLHQLRAAGATHRFASVRKEIQRRRRNRSITRMLIGISLLFIVCHLGKVIVRCYRFMAGGEGQWLHTAYIVNDTLEVLNSSLNFAIYCKDLWFRKCVVKLYNHVTGRGGRNDGSTLPTYPSTADEKSRSEIVARKTRITNSSLSDSTVL